LVLAVALSLAACSTTKPTVEAPEVTAIGNQKLTSNFTRRGVKIEYNCAFGTGMLGMTDAMCSKTDIKSIEVTAYAPSYGNSEAMRENAFSVAEDRAKAKLIRFLNEDIKSTTVTKTITKNIEKANDQIKQHFKGDVENSDVEAEKDTNTAVRDNTNTAVRDFVENVQSQAQGILKGVYVSDEKIVDRQTVEVTIRWDKGSYNSAREIRNLMSK
jgi:hypothetical protein